MRDEQSWRETGLPRAISSFSPRLAKDLREIPYKIKDIPDLGSYYIHGPIGCGKTLLAAWIALEERRRIYLNPEEEQSVKEIIFITVPDFLNDIIATYDDNSRSAQEYLDRLTKAHLLVLDDLGAERSTDWALSMLYLLINRRYEEMNHTIFTSNLFLDELAEKMGDERIPGRIERMCTIMEMKERTAYD